MYPENLTERAQEATLIMRIASLKLDLILAEEELIQFRKRTSRRDSE